MKRKNEITIHSNKTEHAGLIKNRRYLLKNSLSNYSKQNSSCPARYSVQKTDMLTLKRGVLEPKLVSGKLCN